MTPHPLIEQRNKSEGQLRHTFLALPSAVVALIRSALHGDPASRAVLLRVLASLG